MREIRNGSPWETLPLFIKFIIMLCVYGAVKRDATLLDFERCVRLHTLLYVVGSCCIHLQVAYDQIAHVRYIKILTQLRHFLVIFLYLVWFSLCSFLLWKLRDNEFVKNLQFCPVILEVMLEF